MLTEHFVASISAPSKAPNTSVTKDAGIFLHELQPLGGQRSIFKKSATPQHCLAVSEWHVFAAQAGKAVVHVYNREKGNQEATIPFNERITCLVLAAANTVLALGTESGRILLWETCTGRLISTPQSHLQAVTSIVADPTSNILLSGSTDSNIHVWSLPALLSFATVDTSVQNDPRSPIHTLSNHRGAITALVCGHGHSPANIAVSASADQSVIIWDYRKGIALRTYLLGDVPQVLALDAIDRGFYAAYQDGSVQLVDLYASTGATNALYDEANSQTAVQPGDENRWRVEGQELGQALCLGLSWDGSRLLSGHQNGKIVAWDTGKGRFMSVINTLPGPVTNLAMLSPTGFPNSRPRSFKAHAVVKPRVNTDDSSSVNGSMMPGNYTFTTQFTSQLPPTNFSTSALVRGPLGSLDAHAKSEFETALTHPSFPSSMLDSGLAELASWHQASTSALGQNGAENEADYLALDDDATLANGKGKQPTKPSAEQENELLKKQIASLQRLQKVSFQQLRQQRAEIKALIKEQKEMDARLLGIAGRHGEEDDEEGQNIQDDGNDDSEDEDEDDEMESDMSSDRG